ncbi:ATP-binding cassette, subfamily B [Saccharopolyspora shandongensis]|uniref:ATP-binding cassette, subfamily B n=1 Tax=Saccharopolyspora shandongensis TaxID=418495 RepID=A0A1H3SNQ8_9PSEU|nr:hypothetical protein [Saccharopolyspora shandongensis]SDZ39733.1 ATP-binding cassette, subfamily B [Saccharopolyspora shandongensis]
MSALAGNGVLQTMSVIAHLLAPFISACATPLPIIVVMLALDWRLGLAAPLAAPVVAAIQIWTGRSTSAADAERAERDREATGRWQVNESVGRHTIGAASDNSLPTCHQLPS